MYLEFFRLLCPVLYLFSYFKSASLGNSDNLSIHAILLMT